MKGTPTDCNYSTDCIKEAKSFGDFISIGAGCIDCTLINSDGCGFKMSMKERQDIQGDPNLWNMIAHCNEAFNTHGNQPPQSLAGRESDTGSNYPQTTYK